MSAKTIDCVAALKSRISHDVNCRHRSSVLIVFCVKITCKIRKTGSFCRKFPNLYFMGTKCLINRIISRVKDSKY